MTTLVVFAIVLFGTVGYRALPVAALPSVEYPHHPGAGRHARRRSGGQWRPTVADAA